jgi:hypothetical protein
MGMQKRWFVVDNEGNISWDADKDGPQFFTKRATAYKRATELAENAPGQTVYISESVEVLICPVGTVKRLGVRQS